MSAGGGVFSRISGLGDWRGFLGVDERCGLSCARSSASAARLTTRHSLLQPTTSFSCTDADFHRAMVATAPGEELLIGRRKLHLVLGKSTKTDATRAALFDSNMHQIVCRLGCLPPDPTGEAYSAPPDTKLYLGGPSSKGRREEGRVGREFVVCPWKRKVVACDLRLRTVDR